MKKIVLLGAVLWLVGCSAMQGKDALTDEAVVAHKAERRYQAMMAGNYRSAYKLMSPGFRELNTLGDFEERFVGVRSWQKVSIGAVMCDGDVCRVGVSFSYVNRAAGGKASFMPDGTIRDIWGRVDGQWYYLKKE